MVRVILMAVVIAVLGLDAAPAAASDTLAKIREKAEERRQILNLIRNGRDIGEKLAALEEALLREDRELQISAREAAFASKERRLRRAALRHVLNSSRELQVEFERPDRPNGAEAYVYDWVHGLRFKDLKVDPTNDRISVHHRQNQHWSGRLTDTGLTMTYRRPPPYSHNQNCVMTVRIQSGSLLAGKLDCQIISRDTLRRTGGKRRAVLPLRINL